MRHPRVRIQQGAAFERNGLSKKVDVEDAPISPLVHGAQEAAPVFAFA